MQLLTAQMARRLGRIAACYRCRISTNVNIHAYLNSLNIKIRFHVHKQRGKKKHTRTCHDAQVESISFGPLLKVGPLYTHRPVAHADPRQSPVHAL